MRTNKLMDCVEFLEATQAPTVHNEEVEAHESCDNGYETVTEVMHDGWGMQQLQPEFDYHL